MNNINKEILKLFTAYTAKEISEKEFQTLQLWINKETQNKRQFEEYLLFYKKTRSIGLKNTINEVNAWNNIVSLLEEPLVIKNKKPIRKLYWKYTAVASILLIIALTVFVNNQNSVIEELEPIIVNNNIQSGKNQAILTLEDGSTIALEKHKTYRSENIISNGDEIIYDTRNNNIKTIVYNYLTIPKGGQFKVILSDGTKVWLNSDSKLKYPKNFNKGDLREVELIYGEAYFEVSSSVNHGGSKFVVAHELQNIEVLGTEFNVKAYRNEANIYTTLIEGKVAVKIKDKTVVLIPNQQLNFDIIKNSTSTTVVDVYREISWRRGVFSFKNKSLKDIMLVLSRWYDMEVTFSNKKLENIEFNGVINKNQNIEEVLMVIKNFGVIKNYEINDKNLILK